MFAFLFVFVHTIQADAAPARSPLRAFLSQRRRSRSNALVEGSRGQQP